MARRGRSARSWSIVVGLLVVGGAAFAGVRLWQQQGRAARRVTRGDGGGCWRRVRAVQVATIAQGPKERLITLLGDTRPYQVATLYGKVSGYLKSIHGGSRRPREGRAGRGGGGVRRRPIGSTTRRSAISRTSGGMPSASSDLVRAGLDIGAGRPTRRRPRTAWRRRTSAQLAGDEVVRDPARAVRRHGDRALRRCRARWSQSSVTNQTSNQPVMTIADMSRLRVDVYVEQKDVPYVHVGDMADVTDGANPERRKVRARIARTSDQLDPRTRTLFIELDVDNSEGFLVPGSFAYVTLHVPIAELSGDSGGRPDGARHQHVHRRRRAPTAWCICSRSRSPPPTACASAWRRAGGSAIAWRSTCRTR